jgi:hypothetical protein
MVALRSRRVAKRFVAARVVPLLIDLEPADVTMPLASFQGRPLSEDGMLRLVRDMNSVRVNHWTSDTSRAKRSTMGGRPAD